MATTKLYSLDLQAYRSHAIHRKQLDALLEHEWILTGKHVDEVLADALDKYYLLYWSPEYLTGKIANGMLVNQGVEYRVIYTDSFKPCKHTIASGKYRQVALSFRAAKSEYGIFPKVLIKGILA